MALRWAILPAFGLLASGCLFTDPINRAPQARIDEESVGPYYTLKPIVLSARKSRDPDGDPIRRIDWSYTYCGPECGDSDDGEPVAVDPGPRFELPPDAKGRIRVTLTVEDSHGAIGGAEQFFDVINREPQVELQPQGARLPDGSYLVGQPIAAVAEASDPDFGDEVELSFSLVPPPESRPEDVVWEEVSAEESYEEWRLEPDVPGLWEIEVEASDGDGGVASATRTFPVSADTPPCIAATEPLAPGGGAYILGAGDAPRRFSVLAVDDELDPYPAIAGELGEGEASFRWAFASPETGGAFSPVSGRDAPDFVVDPAEHSPGDRLSLRVDVHDRIERDIPCGDDRLTCSIGDNGCIQRTTWEVEIR